MRGSETERKKGREGVGEKGKERRKKMREGKRDKQRASEMCPP